ncbi:MAG TPA: metallophosphoesterase [Thermoclostridium caenicola]|nr:metallophosphoesterase [Thermoclostridium caenicola]
MAIYALSDLHLSFGTDKPMDVFGDIWKNHAQRIRENWCRVVANDDVVLIPGDISWAINLDEAVPDFHFIESLPGTKIISKGNHDYWWSTKRKFQAFLEANGFRTIHMLHNNAYRIGDYVICGTRGWNDPGDPDFTEEDRKIFRRELERLRLSLEEGKRLGGGIIAMLHYPPFDDAHSMNDFGALLKEYGVEVCVYGHIHGRWDEAWKDETVEGIKYALVSADFLSFTPMRII